MQRDEGQRDCAEDAQGEDSRTPVPDRTAARLIERTAVAMGPGGRAGVMVMRRVLAAGLGAGVMRLPGSWIG